MVALIDALKQIRYDDDVKYAFEKIVSLFERGRKATEMRLFVQSGVDDVVSLVSLSRENCSFSTFQRE